VGVAAGSCSVLPLRFSGRFLGEFSSVFAKLAPRPAEYIVFLGWVPGWVRPAQYSLAQARDNVIFLP